MSGIRIGQVRHHAGDRVTEEVARWFAEGDRTGDLISDQSAAAIAGYFAGPTANDMPFTRLAQTGEGDTAELGMAIKRELDAAEADEDTGVRDGLLMLEALDAWVSMFETP